MNILLEFIYNKVHYVIFECKGIILIGNKENNDYVKINDSSKLFLREIINILIDDHFEEKFLHDKKIIVLNKSKVILPSNGKNLIGLNFDKNQKKILIDRCKTLDTKKSISKKNRFILPIFIVLIIVISFMILGIIRDDGHKKLYQQYMNISKFNQNNFKNLQISVKSIENKESANLFQDKYLSFEKFCEDDYELIKNVENNNLNLNIYHSNNCPYISVFKTKSEIQDNLRNLEINSLNLDKTIDVDRIYLQYNINNILDLMYHAINYYQKNITAKSPKKEIVDGIYFESIKKLIIPYNSESSKNNFIFYKGNISGYSYITDDSINIFISNNDNDYKIIIQNSNDKPMNIETKDIDNIMNTINIYN